MNKIKIILMQPILVVFLVVTTFSSAFGQISNVQVSNLTSSSATITWTTVGSTDGCVNYGLSTALGDTTCDTRPSDDVHYVDITGVSVDTTYYFEVVSGGTTDNNGGAYYTFRTAKVGSGIPYVIFGHVLLPDGISPAVGVIVSVQVESNGDFSELLTDLTDLDVAWSLNLGNLKSPIDGTVFSYNTGDSIFIHRQGAADGIGQDTVIISGVSPQYCGTEAMTVGLVEPGEFTLPRYYLAANYPNPFNPGTTIKFGLPIAGHVELSIYDVRGQRVMSLINDVREAGEHVSFWNGRDANGQPVSSGVYFYCLKSGKFEEARKMVLLK